ncbi:MAG TPA: response regulator [Candidatus Ozemobacteraceae bacterium]|nr:response regulator [Candidatus Ozemobacteraceae bacterium]
MMMMDATKSSGPRRRILIVDDEEQILLLLKTILNVYGYESIEVVSPKETFAKVKAEQPDLVILDIAMPEMDGYQVCKLIKSDPASKNIPVVMITALALEQDRKCALEAGADGFILKPFDPRDVIAEIEKLCGGRQSS